jgi:hypothetical protein
MAYVGEALVSRSNSIGAASIIMAESLCHCTGNWSTRRSGAKCGMRKVSFFDWWPDVVRSGVLPEYIVLHSFNPSELTIDADHTVVMFSNNIPVLL